MSYNVEKGKNGTSSERKEFRTFEDLEVYQVAREFRKKMYAVTRRLPDFEKYLETAKIEALKNEAWRVLGLINGYLRYLRDRKAHEASVVRETNRTSTEDDCALALLDEALSSAPPF